MKEVTFSAQSMKFFEILNNIACSKKDPTVITHINLRSEVVIFGV